MGKKKNRCKKCVARTSGKLRPRLKVYIQTLTKNLWKCPHCGHEVARPVRKRKNPQYSTHVKVGGMWYHQDQPIQLKEVMNLLGRRIG